jgi:DNA-binding IclR family transcriptional regulator
MKAGQMATQKMNSIEKALQILKVFPPDNRPMGTVEISKILGFHKATTSRMLLVLTKKGLLRQDKETRKFSLGSSALDIGRAMLDSLSSDITVIGRPHIDQLRDDLGETVVLEQFMVESTVITHMAEGAQRVRLAGGIGDRLPLNATAGAKSILAFLEPGVAEELIRTHADFKSYTPNTITDPDRLIEQLAGIRQRRYAFDSEENEYGISAIGVPVFNHDGLPVASVVVVGLTAMIDRNFETILDRIRQTSRRISSLLMHG